MQMHLRGGSIIRLGLIVVCILVQGSYAQQDRFIAHAKAFLASPGGGGEENALSNYVRAMEKFDTQTYLQHDKVFNRILQYGWTGSEQNEMNTLRSLQPVLNEIWRGNEKLFVKYPPVESVQSPVPNFLKLQLLGKLMVIQALYCEHVNRPNYATEWCKHALIFGQRVCNPNSGFLFKTYSLIIELNTLKRFQQFLIRHNLSKDLYLKIAYDLTKLRSSEIPCRQLIEEERRFAYDYIKESPEENGMIEQPVWEGGRIKHVLGRKETVLKEYEEFTKATESLFQKDYAGFVNTDFKTLTENYSPFLKVQVRSFWTTPIEEGETYANWALTIATAQVRAYRVEKGSLPTSLSALGEIGVSPPADPFSNTTIKYRVSGNSGILYSIGPDLIDNGGSPDYDPTNGTISSGDITVAVR